MSWEIYHGNRESHDYVAPDSPPWRRFPLPQSEANEDQTFIPTEEIVQAVNAAIHLRRPLLITGPPGSGKSSVAESVAQELRLGRVLRWHVTSHSTLEEAMYRYDALGRLQYNQLNPGDDDITSFLRLGPLGTALLGQGKPRVLLIDELDKGELDLPSDLLTVLERGEYEIPELNRLGEIPMSIREVDSDDTHLISGGRISCSVFPIIVMTSNGEREFPGPFLRRCVRINLNLPDEDRLIEIVTAHFNDPAVAASERELIRAFAERISSTSGRPARLAVDQLLNSIFLLTHSEAPSSSERDRLLELVQRELDRT
jgi:MoxR-like ATPase